jgi:hypothetical protein
VKLDEAFLGEAVKRAAAKIYSALQEIIWKPTNRIALYVLSDHLRGAGAEAFETFNVQEPPKHTKEQEEEAKILKHRRILRQSSSVAAKIVKALANDQNRTPQREQVVSAEVHDFLQTLLTRWSIDEAEEEEGSSKMS